jgi:HSP20 family protein
MMNNLRVFDPTVNDVFDPFFRRFFSPMRLNTEVEAPEVRIEVEEKEKNYIVRADIPGVKKEDINVRIDGNIVQIDAETRQEKDVKEKGKILRSERYYGAVSRAFSLAREVDESKAIAKYENGVLTLDLPMSESVGAKRLTIQ